MYDTRGLSDTYDTSIVCNILLNTELCFTESSEPSHKTKNLDGNQQSSFIESSKSLGCGNISPTNSDCLSPLKEELLRASTPQPSNIKDITKSKAKPKIISDNILPNNAIILPGPQNVHKKRIQLKFSPNSLTKSNDGANSR